MSKKKLSAISGLALVLFESADFKYKYCTSTPLINSVNNASAYIDNNFDLAIHHYIRRRFAIKTFRYSVRVRTGTLYISYVFFFYRRIGYQRTAFLRASSPPSTTSSRSVTSRPQRTTEIRVRVADAFRGRPVSGRWRLRRRRPSRVCLVAADKFLWSAVIEVGALCAVSSAVRRDSDVSSNLTVK